MEEYYPGEVYKNLIKMMALCNITLTKEPVNNEVLATTLNNNQYITLTGTRPETDPRGEALIVVILIAPNSKYASRSEDFKKLLKGLPKAKMLEVIFITEDTLSTHLEKHMKLYMAENTWVHLERYSYDIFLIENTQHVSVDKHTIMTQDEVNEFCKTHHTNPMNLAAIKPDDPQAIWNGVKRGMVVRITRVSDTAGISINYRHCR